LGEGFGVAVIKLTPGVVDEEATNGRFSVD